MTCSICLTTTPELQTIDASGHCPRCGTNYGAWVHSVRLTSPQLAYNERTRKLVSNGAAHRDKLVAARINVRSN